MKKRRNQTSRFAICVIDSEPDLELRKVYEILPDDSAAQSDYVRVVDESGEDYLYPAKYFVSVKVPTEARRKLLVCSEGKKAVR